LTSLTQAFGYIGLLVPLLIALDLIHFGDEWSSRIPFCSERKSLAVPHFTRQPAFKKIIADPQSFLDGAKLGGVIDCRLPQQWQTYRPRANGKNRSVHGQSEDHFSE
jgi:hypothetical protein